MSVILLKTMEDYKKILLESGGKLLVVDFFADWCGPCKTIAPKFAAFAAEYTNVVFAKVNADESEIAEACNVTALPTFHFYKNGQKLKEVQGADEGKLKEFIVKNK